MNQLFGHPTDARAEVDLGSPAAPPRPLPVGGAEQAFFHLDIKRSLQLHWRLARKFAIGGVVLAILYFLSQAFLFKTWPVYEADSMVYVQPTPSKVLETNQGNSRWPFDTNTYESYIGQQMMNVTRDDVLASALKKLGDFQDPGESEQKAAQRLVRALIVTREGSAYAFSIGARAGNPEFAADIANDVTAAYLESIARDQRAGDAQRLTMLGDERDRIAKALEADRSEQEELNKQLGVASVGSSVPDHFDEDISGTRAELIKARIDHDAAAAKIAALNAGKGVTSAAIDAAADEIIANDAGLVSMKTTLNQRRATLISQMANLTPSHPQYKQDEVELGKINNELDTMMKDLRAKAAARIQLQLQSELQRTAGVEAQVNGQLRTLVGAAGSATPKMQRSSDLASDITRLQARFSTVDEQLRNLMLEDNAPAAAYQVTPAVPPLNRSKSGVLRNVVLIIFAGIFFGIMAAVAKHKLDPKIYVAKDVELILGFAPMALLPDFNEVSGGVAEEYLLRLASTIEHARKQSHLRSCVFTGTSAGNGVTTLVNRVGGMLEGMGRPTVLVDASGAPAPDRHPRLTGADNLPGLVPVNRVSRPTALLHQMVEETESQDESLVLTDTAPLPVSAETEYLARFVDCAIVVIESGKTTRRELREAAATLQRLDVAAVGFVLNRVGLDKADPAFRDSVQAIEKHLDAQAASHNAFRAEAARRFSTARPWPTEELPAGDPPSQESPARAHFETELAAASAAVERLSHPANADGAAVSSSPAEPAPPSAARFSLPAAWDQAPPPAASWNAAPVEDFAPETPAPSVAEVSAEASQDAPVPRQQPSAPFADAARHFSSQASPEPSLAQRFGGDFSPFAVKAEHLVSNLAGPYPAASPVAVEPAPIATQHPEYASFLKTEEPFFTTAQHADGLQENGSEFSGESAPQSAVEAGDPPPLEQAAAAAQNSRADRIEPPAAATPVSEARIDQVSASPWWPADPAPDRFTNRPPLLWKPARVSMAHRPIDGHDPRISHPGAEPPQHRANEPHSGEAAVAANGFHPGADYDQEDLSATNLSSRLSGLRNLLFVLGVKNGQEAGESGDRRGANGSNLESRTERQAFETQQRDQVPPAGVGGASPRLVTAPPEFLPPRTVSIDAGRDDAPAGEPASRQDRRAPYDGVDILPSRRGQYKKV
jgi:succinoglycan biosynthesis transport protein ExoP